METGLMPTEDVDFAPCKPDNSSEGALSPFKCKEMPFMTMLSTACPFNPDIFLSVMLNLIKNPNITSSHLFRADIFYDSLNDATFNLETSGVDLTARAKHMKEEYRPIRIDVEEYERSRLIIRQMIPRNPQLDKPLVQTCHILKQDDRKEQKESTLVILLPHATSIEEIPWYHPKVRCLAFLHVWKYKEAPEEACQMPNMKSQGQLSLHVCNFPNMISDADSRLKRTLLNLLQISHKHGLGHLRGYQKRVHHDRIVPQRAFQDTYTRLKTKYAKQLIGAWAEQTDPVKHVFEDLGIAAFCIELWRRMYICPAFTRDIETNYSQIRSAEDKDYSPPPDLPIFPGFLDMGCGNGVLVYILLSEGYPGWGFDAKRRKTWATFPPSVQQNLKQLVLIPSILSNNSSSTTTTPLQEPNLPTIIFPTPNSNVTHHPAAPHHTFLISNHADELTLWTPLLAFANASSFLCIPCCSHDFSGARFRAPIPAQAGLEIPKESQNPKNSPNLTIVPAQAASTPPPPPPAKPRRQPRPSQPSAYACLTAYVATLSTRLGFAPELEMLRIPSTRNACVVGRWAEGGDREVDLSAGSEDRQVEAEDVLRELVLGEIERVIGGKGLGIEDVGRAWRARGEGLVAGSAGGH